MTDWNDILIDVNGDGDLMVRNGDFVIGNSDTQNVKLILEADKAQIRQFPLLGAGIRRQVSGSVDGRVRREIQLQLESDGYKSNQITYKDDVLSVKI